MKRALAALIAAALALTACAATAAERSRIERAAFTRTHPCPATGEPRGACPGWQVDHIVPLCNGGADDRRNMQWLTVEAHAAKTRTDVRTCANRSTRAQSHRPHHCQ